MVKFLKAPRLTMRQVKQDSPFVSTKTRIERLVGAVLVPLPGAATVNRGRPSRNAS